MNTKYELMLILPGTLDDKEVEKRAEEVLQMVKDHADNAELTSMGKNRLAYPIKQIRYGYFYTIVFNAEQAKVKLLEDKIRLTSDILRGMISHFNVSLTMQQRSAYAAQPLANEAFEPRVSPEVMADRVNALVGAEDTTEGAKPVASTAARDLEKLDIASINKKLDDLMQGDVIPGV